MTEEQVQKAKEHFGKLVKEQLERVEMLKKDTEWTDYSKLEPIDSVLSPHIKIINISGSVIKTLLSSF